MSQKWFSIFHCEITDDGRLVVKFPVPDERQKMTIEERGYTKFFVEIPFAIEFYGVVYNPNYKNYLREFIERVDVRLRERLQQFVGREGLTVKGNSPKVGIFKENAIIIPSRTDIPYLWGMFNYIYFCWEGDNLDEPYDLYITFVQKVYPHLTNMLKEIISEEFPPYLDRLPPASAHFDKIVVVVSVSSSPYIYATDYYAQEVRPYRREWVSFEVPESLLQTLKDNPATLLRSLSFLRPQGGNPSDFYRLLNKVVPYFDIITGAESKAELTFGFRTS